MNSFKVLVAADLKRAPPEAKRAALVHCKIFRARISSATPVATSLNPALRIISIQQYFPSKLNLMKAKGVVAQWCNRLGAPCV